MIVRFWSWNLSDTTHVRSHTKFQLIWAIYTAFTSQMWSWDPLSIRVKTCKQVVASEHLANNLHTVI